MQIQSNGVQQRTICNSYRSESRSVNDTTVQYSTDGWRSQVHRTNGRRSRLRSRGCMATLSHQLAHNSGSRSTTVTRLRRLVWKKRTRCHAVYCSGECGYCIVQSCRRYKKRDDVCWQTGMIGWLWDGWVWVSGWGEVRLGGVRYCSKEGWGGMGRGWGVG